MGAYKDKHGKTRVGAFLQKVAPHIVDTVGDILPDKGVLGVVKNLIDKDDKLTPEQKETALKMLNYDLENTKDARDLQKVALQQDDIFSKRFLYYMAAFWSFVASIYLFFVTFNEVKNDHVADTVLGFLLGTIIATIINFFFGSSNQK